MTVRSPAPAVAVWHEHTGQCDIGKLEPAGLAGSPMHHTGAALAKLGYAAIHRMHLLHCFPNFIPGREQFGDIPDIVGLIAPRALHLNIGETDDGSPIEEVRQAMPVIADAYAKAGAADKFSHFIEMGVGHVLSDAMWAKASAWFERHLRS